MNNKKIFIIFFIISISFISYPTLFAQNLPSEASRDRALIESTRQIRSKVEEELIKAPKKPPQIKEDIVEAPIEGPAFFVKKIELEGVNTFKKEDFNSIIEKYENKDLAIGQLKTLTKQIEREYLRKGVISACFIPPQDIEEGTVILRVIEAKMGILEVNEARWFSHKNLDYYWTIKEGEVLRYDKISRILQIMNKNPDRTVKAALHAGKKVETTDVTLNMETNFPIHATLSFDNEGTPSTGKQRKGIGLIDNNFLGIDDTLLGGYTGGKSFNGLYFYHKVPLTYFGTTLLYGYNQSISYPKKDYAVFEINSKSQDFSAFLYQDLFYKDEYKGELSFGFDANNKRVVSGAQGTLNADRLRMFIGGLTLINRAQGSVTSFKPEIYQGVNGFGARRKNEFSSRQAENTFTKIVINSSFRQGLAKNFQGSFKFKGQLASEKLAPQQQLYLGGIDSVRGYPSGDYLADSGFSSNFELLVPAFIIPEWVRIPYGERPIRDELTGVVFFDCGYGMDRGDRQGELSYRRMASIGGGARVRLFNQFNVRLEVGVPLEPLVNGPITEFSRSRMHFSVDFQDSIPEEVERFQRAYREDYIKEASWRVVNAQMKDVEGPLAQAIYVNLAKAKLLYESGDLEGAKEYYAKVSGIGNTVYKQARMYLTENYNNADRLRKENDKAEELFRNGEIEKAREIWAKISEDTEVRPLVLEFI